MENFQHFSDLEIKIIRTEFGRLLGIEGFEKVLTGFNYYYQSIKPENLIVAISFLHRAEELKRRFIADLKLKDNTKSLISKKRIKEIPLVREKKAIYHAESNFLIQKDPITNKLDKDVTYFDFMTGEDIPIKTLEEAKYIGDITKKYPRYRNIGIKEINGFEINLNIKTKEEAEAVLNLLREKAYKFKIGKNGLPLYTSEGEEIINEEAYPLADVVPCIILGKNLETLIDGPLLDFTKCQKLTLIKESDEISSLTHITTDKLKEHPSYLTLKKQFSDLLQENTVYANNYLVIQYIDKI